MAGHSKHSKIDLLQGVLFPSTNRKEVLEMPSNPKILGTVAANFIPHLRVAFGLTDPQVNKLIDRIHCFAFKVRLPRKDVGSCNKTPYFNRWDIGQTSHLTPANALYASQAQCEEVAAILLAQLFEAEGFDYDFNRVPELKRVLGHNITRGNLRCLSTNQLISSDDIRRALGYSTQRLGSYDIPTTYIRELNAGGLHRANNVAWIKPIHILYTLRNIIKEDLLNSGAIASSAKNALDKIQVKAYCTDKVTMPPHFSNRDIRWATWPNSIQYSSHYDCAMLELELMAQLYEFYGAPNLDEGIAREIALVRGNSIQPNSRKCYITGRNMDYQLYLQSAANPQGGRSPYHVGHIIPLTRQGRHDRQNVAWISDDGNRIQGNDTIEEIEQKLIDSVEYHLRRDLENGSANLDSKVTQLWRVLNDIRRKRTLPVYTW
jgi:hypothetical protein